MYNKLFHILRAFENDQNSQVTRRYAYNTNAYSASELSAFQNYKRFKEDSLTDFFDEQRFYSFIRKHQSLIEELAEDIISNGSKELQRETERALNYILSKK